MPLDFIKDSFIGLLLDFIKNSFFAKQCSLIDNGAVLRSLFPLITEKSLSDVDFSVEGIKNIISKLDSNKAHGDDMISIRMLKLCDQSIFKTLSIVFKSCLTQGIFPSEWKKTNVLPTHKKNDKQCVTIYRPISLFPVCSKGLKLIICNTMFTYFIENNLISENQSGFKPVDSCVNQLLAIDCEIFFSFDKTTTKLEGHPLTFRKLSIKCGTRELFINLNQTGSKEIH